MGPGEVGELRAKCAHGMMLGYLEKHAGNIKYLDEEGFGCSGDLGRYDQEGNLFYVGRMKSLIKYRTADLFRLSCGT